ncbi:MAG: iron-containing alcohol dehydrogenase [Clostridia bacterium]|nr:iron-containing alcohol dehydrogenase [Clostridia bacterium]
MNIVKKIYCRAFQTVLHLALPFLPYRNPVILRSTAEIPGVLREQGIDSVLIVTDASLSGLGMTEPLCGVLKEAGISYTVFDETVPNPTVKNVEDARALYLQNGCRGLIAFGGGSPIDCAKAVGARIARPKKPIAGMAGILKVCKRIPYLVAIPTTAGTGSETTVTAVITDGDTRHKFTVNDFPLIPRCAVLDPDNTKGLPPFMTATTGMDAMTHAVEAFIGGSTTKSTRADALRAARLIVDNLPRAYADGADMEARSAMSEAAHLAGRAFSKSYVGYCHAVAHTLGGKYNIPHGLANAVLLPYVLHAYGDTVYGKLKKMAVAVGIADQSTPAPVAANAFIEKLEQMNREMGIPTTLKGIRREDVPALARKAEREANPLYPVPRLMTAVELERFYYDVME